MREDRLWMYNKNLSNRQGLTDAFVKGVEEFILFSMHSANSLNGGNILCPCRKCRNRKFQDSEICRGHLYRSGFLENYYTWVCHGEAPTQFVRISDETVNIDSESNVDNMISQHRMVSNVATSYDPPEQNDGASSSSHTLEDDRVKTNKFWESLNAADQPIWSGHPSETQLSATARLISLKSALLLQMKTSCVALVRNHCSDGWQGPNSWRMLYGLDVNRDKNLVIVADNFGFFTVQEYTRSNFCGFRFWC